MTAKAHEKLDELEKEFLDVWRRRVDEMRPVCLSDYLDSSETFHKLREMRDQVDVCLGNIDEIRMALYKLPFGTEAEEDEEA